MFPNSSAMYRLESLTSSILPYRNLIMCPIYCKIPIISPGAYFWSKGLFAKFFLEGLIFRGGGGAYLRLENDIFCSSNCNLF